LNNPWLLIFQLITMSPVPAPALVPAPVPAPVQIPLAFDDNDGFDEDAYRARYAAKMNEFLRLGHP
jgi:hypothetical protein